MKNFYLRIITIIFVIIGGYLTLNYYYKYTQNRNFQIINERQSVLIQLPNTEYIEISSKNDHVKKGSEVVEHPFSVNTKIQKNSGMENSIVSTNAYIEYIENGESNTRLLNLEPKNDSEIEVDINARTAYLYEENLIYNIQIDYSNKTEFKEKDGYVYFEDKGCRVVIQNGDTSHKASENGQSLILSTTYDLEVDFNFNFLINCEE